VWGVMVGRRRDRVGSTPDMVTRKGNPYFIPQQNRSFNSERLH
jgi:hypothetical protein